MSEIYHRWCTQTLTTARRCCRSRSLSRPQPRLLPTLSAQNQRHYAIQSTTQQAPVAAVFNASQKDRQRTRAVQSDPTLSRATDYIRSEVASRLVTRLLDIDRRYDRVLDWGAGPCTIARALTNPDPEPDLDAAADSDGAVAGHGEGHGRAREPLSSRMGHLICADANAAQLYRDEDLALPSPLSMERVLLADHESVPFEADSLDLVLSCGSLHWTNDLPGVLAGINRALKPDGAFLAAMPGGDTLFELRGSLQLAEQERRGGVGAHVSPLADVRDVGNLLNRAGFKLLTVDVDDIVVSYPDLMALLRDLRAMGESNASLRMEPGPLSRDVLLAADAIYRDLYGEDDGTIPATFRTIYMIGWKEGEGQAKPLPRGSGQVDLKGFLEGGNK